jgi:hypothetical protein
MEKITLNNSLITVEVNDLNVHTFYELYVGLQ